MENTEGSGRVTGLLLMFLGAGIGAAVWGVLVVNSRPRPGEQEEQDDLMTDSTAAAAEALGDPAQAKRLKTDTKTFPIWQIVAAAAGFFGVWPLTGYVGLGVAAAEVALLLPLFWKASKAYTLLVSREEALMAWVGNIRDMIRGGSNVQRALTLSAEMGQPPIDGATNTVAQGLRVGVGLREVLFLFAEQVASPTADRLVATLITSSEQGAAGIVDMLNHLVDDTRRSVTSTREIIRERKKVLNNSRAVSIIFTAMIAAAAVFMADIMRGYKGVTGQFILIITMLCWGGCVLWLYSLNRPPGEYRITLTTPEEQEEMILAVAEEATADE